MDQVVAYLNTLNPSVPEYIVMGVMGVSFLYQLYFYIRYMAGVNRVVRREKKAEQPSEPAQWPGVTVIVSARNEAYNLKEYLLHLLEQDYPEFEVVVINDGSEDSTDGVLSQLLLRYKNLRLTFVPKDARVGSSKKLALTLGAKAAHYDLLLLTDADCVPESNQWIRQMMSRFTEDKDIVLGFSPYFQERGMLNDLISYDTLFTGLQYMGMALSHHPYMGVGRNLAYRKQTFFSSGGFTPYLALKAGDDDLLVNHLATARNTAVVCSRESIVWSVPKDEWGEWLHQKRRHLSVSPHYKASTKCRLTIEPITRALFYLSVIAACCLATPLMWALAALLFLTRLVITMTIINRSARHFHTRRVGLQIVLYDICLPLLTLTNMLILAIFPSKRNRW